MKMPIIQRHGRRAPSPIAHQLATIYRHRQDVPRAQPKQSDTDQATLDLVSPRSSGNHRRITFLLAGLLLSSTMICPPPAVAQIPVTDGASIAQNLLNHIQSMAQWAQQLTALQSQLATAQQAYSAVTGVRNLGMLFNNPNIRASLPADYSQVLQGGSALYGAGQSVLQSNQLQPGNYQANLAAVNTRTSQLGADTSALMTQAQQGLTARMQELDSLQQEINTTQDPKAIAELQARLQVEQANIAVDQMRANNLAQQINAEKALADDQVAQLTQRSFSMDAITNPTSGQ